MLAHLVTLSPALADDEGTQVYLVPIGDLPAGLLDEVAYALRLEYGAAVVRMDATPLPKSAYHPPRRRYRAERLLEFLDGLVPQNAGRGARILGITAVDISTTKDEHPDWGVFGLGELGGRASVISTFRLRRGARDDAHVALRVRTTAIHEIGHTLGLPHCTEPRCVMLDAEGSIHNTDTSTGHLGTQCRGRLAAVRPASQ